MTARIQESIFFAIAFGILCVQLLIPPYIGMPDNGDFGKISLRYSVAPVAPITHGEYLNADYVFDPARRWDGGMRSAEEIPAAAAFLLSGALKPGGKFNIRWLGAIHAAIFLCAFAAFLMATRAERPWQSVFIRGFVFWVFSDVLYVSYLNSFYTDAIAMLGILGTVAAAMWIVREERLRAWPMFVFGAFSLLLIGSKPQHAVLAFLPAAFLLLIASKRGNARTKWLAAGMICVQLGLSAFILAATPMQYRTEPAYNVMFQKIAVVTRGRPAALAELGLTPADRKYIGHETYEPGSPMEDPAWLQDFGRRAGSSAVIRFYLHHPGAALTILNGDLQQWAKYIRWDFSNYRRQDATRPWQRSQRFALWSDLRIRLFFLWPDHILLWYTLIALGVTAVIRANVSFEATAAAWILAGLILAAIAEFCESSLLDSVETYRHFFLFHAITDVTVCMALGGLVTGVVRKDLIFFGRRNASTGV